MADGVDFAIAAYRSDGAWRLDVLPDDVVEDVDDLLDALDPADEEDDALALVSVEEDFFVLARLTGDDDVRVLLSDVTAVDEWPLASSVADLLDVPDPEDDDEPQPAGDIDIVSDLGVSAVDLARLCDSDDLYADEMLRDLARRLGFATELDALLDAQVDPA